MTQQDGNASSNAAFGKSSNAAFDKDSEGNPGQVLGLSDATAIIVGLIVGAGIFGTPAIVAGAAGSESMALLAWGVEIGRAHV